MTTPIDNKTVIRRLVTEVINDGRLELVDELYAPQLVAGARRWISAFREAFPDVHMEIVQLIAEDDQVVGRYTCTATHTGTWRGRPPSGRRFERVDEVGIYRLRDGKITHAWALEDTWDRMRQLRLGVSLTFESG